MNKKNNSKWYIVQVISNYEQKVKDFLENRIYEKDEPEIDEIYIPLKAIKTKTGKIKKRPMFPSYIYIKLDMTDKMWFVIRNTEYVTGIIGSSGQRTKPTPITEEEVLKIKKREEKEFQDLENIKNISNKENAIKEIDFEVGDFVEIKEGEFVNNKGKISSISIIKQKITIDLEMFGRITSVEVPIDFIKKI